MSCAQLADLLQIVCCYVAIGRCYIYIYSDIVLMGIGVLYLWATDSGPSLSWQPRLIVAGNSRRTGGGLLW